MYVEKEEKKISSIQAHDQILNNDNRRAAKRAATETATETAEETAAETTTETTTETTSSSTSNALHNRTCHVCAERLSWLINIFFFLTNTYFQHFRSVQRTLLNVT